MSLLFDNQPDGSGAPRGAFFKFCRDFKIAPASILFDEANIMLLRHPDGRFLEDIRTVEENEFAGDQICEFVRGLTGQPEARLHASAAGGRKTMGIYLTAAMQLFGRAQDEVSHVLVSEEFETGNAPEFFYPPPRAVMLKTRDGRTISTDAARIHLAPIPFIRLCSLSAEWRKPEYVRSYAEVVERAQTRLDIMEKEDVVRLDLARNHLKVRGREIKLSPREMFFYVMFAAARQKDATTDANGISLYRLRRGDFERTLRRMTAARGKEFGLERAGWEGGFSFLEKKMIKLLESSRGVDRDEFIGECRIIFSRIKSKIRKANLPDEYAIALCEADEKGCYWLPIAPHRIEIE